MEGFSAFAVATILVWSNRYATAVFENSPGFWRQYILFTTRWLFLMHLLPKD
jgi:hypothetical protein